MYKRQGSYALGALLNAGADVNFLKNDGIDDILPLDLASDIEDVTILEKLLDHGADVTAADSNGCTALHKVAYWNMFSPGDIFSCPRVFRISGSVRLYAHKSVARATPTIQFVLILLFVLVLV